MYKFVKNDKIEHFGDWKTFPGLISVQHFSHSAYKKLSQNSNFASESGELQEVSTV